MAFVTLDDRTARIEIRVFSEVYESYRDVIANDKILVVQGALSYDDFSDSMRVNAERVLDKDAVRNEYATRLVLSLDAGNFRNGLLDHLIATLTPHREGRCSIWVHYRGADAQAQIIFDQSWKVQPNEALLQQLQSLIGERRVRLEYR